MANVTDVKRVVNHSGLTIRRYHDREPTHGDVDRDPGSLIPLHADLPLIPMKLTPVLTAPCENCPFRTDVRPYISAARAKTITDALLRGESFPCHKTIDYRFSAKGRVTKNTKMCGGAAVMLAHMDQPNAIMQVAERLGCLDTENIKKNSPVYKTPEEMIEAHK